MVNTQPDILVVGAGPVGCVVAEQVASQLGWTCVVIEKRAHIGGNCFDRAYHNGVLIHEYGPHIFRTSNKALIDYLSQFTSWVNHEHIAQSYLNGELYPFPINLDTLEKFFNRPFDAQSAQAFLTQQAIPCEAPQNSKDFVLSRVGPELYHAFYENYTRKQWGRDPSELDPKVCGRIPTKWNRNPYFTDTATYRVMPAHGFTAMFEKMLAHPRIDVLLETDYLAQRHQFKPTIATVYCGPLDAYFDHCLGHLPWRSMRFEFATFSQPFKQPCSVINYPNDYEYTRSFEAKHVTRQEHPETVISYDYPQATGEPYYPIPSAQSNALYQQYTTLVEQETQQHHVYFAGRLGRYAYINTDEAFESALDIVDTLKTRYTQAVRPH